MIGSLLLLLGLGCSRNEWQHDSMEDRVEMADIHVRTGRYSCSVDPDDGRVQFAKQESRERKDDPHGFSLAKLVAPLTEPAPTRSYWSIEGQRLQLTAEPDDPNQRAVPHFPGYRAGWNFGDPLEVGGDVLFVDDVPLDETFADDLFGRLTGQEVSTVQYYYSRYSPEVDEVDDSSGLDTAENDGWQEIQ